MFEISGADEAVSRRAMKLAAYKLPIKCKIISRTEQEAAQKLEAEAQAKADAAAVATAAV
jgi:large subunit ribosomal protein L16